MFGVELLDERDPISQPLTTKPTSLSEARSAIEANLHTREGKAYGEQSG